MRVRCQSYRTNEYFVFTLNLNREIPDEHQTGEYGQSRLYVNQLSIGLPYTILKIDGVENVRTECYSIDISINPAFATTEDMDRIFEEIKNALCTYVLPAGEIIDTMEPLISKEAPELYTYSPYGDGWEWGYE